MGERQVTDEDNENFATFDEESTGLDAFACAQPFCQTEKTQLSTVTAVEDDRFMPRNE